MKIGEPAPELLDAATRGVLAALDAVLVTIQPGVFNLAVRMLGNRDDAADATQEILLRVATHLGGFRGESAFATWVFRIARNHLLNASTRSRESPEVSLEGISEKLRQGLDYTASPGSPPGSERSLTPEDKLAARQIALGCTQNMLMALDREQRLVYLLDVLFGLASREAAEVLEITAVAYRQRLARARAKLETFAAGACGEASRDAACRCDRQLPALAALRARAGPQAPTLIAVHAEEKLQAERQFDALLRMGDAAAVFRAHPDYRPPASMIAAIRAVLTQEGYLGDGGALH